MYTRLNKLTKDLPERIALLCADILFGDKLLEAQEARQRRMNGIKKIDQCNEDGKVALIEGGRDCDGVQYEGYVYIVDASIKAVEAEMEMITGSADGPVWFDIMKPSEAKHVQYSSRDLALEAFEDGHPHVLYAGS